MANIFKWLLKKEHTILAFEAGEDGHMIFGHTDENTDSNVLAMFMAKGASHVEQWYDLEYLSISSHWKLFNRFETLSREIFLHDMTDDDE
tara:strand:- start:8479 stop:8748 length:270 start_codon:yes stop_codon:yes gene_type:complete